MSDEAIIQVEGVSKKFCRSLRQSLAYGLMDLGREVAGRASQGSKLRSDEFWALKNVSFSARRGETLALIGRNGAGKSTMLKMLNGVLRPDVGRITVKGRVQALIELGAGFSPILSARENVYINAAMTGAEESRAYPARAVDIVRNRIQWTIGSPEGLTDLVIERFWNGLPQQARSWRVRRAARFCAGDSSRCACRQPRLRKSM